MKGSHLGEFEELVLLSTRRLGGEVSVVGIRDVLAEWADRTAALGAIYAALDRAERKGLVSSRVGKAPVTGGKARRFYDLTDAGVAALHKSRRVREALWETPPEVVG